MLGLRSQRTHPIRTYHFERRVAKIDKRRDDLAIFASSSRRSLGERRCDAGYYENQQHVDHEKREGSVGRDAL